MTDEEIYQLIEEHKEETDALYNRIHEQVESSIVQHAVAQKKRKKLLTRVFSAVGAFVLILSLAIALPIVLQPGEENPDGETSIWYSELDLYSLQLDYNLKEYARRNNETFLYIDLNEMEDIETRGFYEANNESVTLYLQELFTYEGYPIKLTIIRQGINVEQYENFILNPQKLDFEESDTDIYYSINKTRSSAQFEYKDYKYYLEFNDQIDEMFLTEILDNMFSTQQAVA